MRQSQDCRDCSDMTNASLSKMAGNGMHLASAGFVMLTSMLFLQPAKQVVEIQD